MSETAPRSNPRLDNFETNKAAHEAEQENLARENYENEFKGEAGLTDFSDEAKQTLIDEDAYQQRRESTPQGESTEDYYDRMLREAEEQEHGPHLPVEGTLEHAEHEAYGEKENREAEEAAYLEAERRALDAKIENNPQLRLMNNMAREIAELRAQTDPDDPDALIKRVQNREDALNTLLAKYENNELFTINKDKDSLFPTIKTRVEYDPAVADAILDRTRDEELELRNSEEARRRADEEKLSPVDDKDIEDKDGTDGAELNPVDDSNLPDRDPDLTPVDDTDLENKEDDSDIPPVDDSNLPPYLPYELPAIEDSGDRNGNPLTRIFRGERVAPGEKRKMIRIALGAAALAITGVALAWLQHKGVLFGGGGARAQEVIDGATGGGHPADGIGSGLDLDTGNTPFDSGIDMAGGNPPVDTLPASGDFTYPWDWASEAVGKENATTWLHELSDKAANAGYTIEWHGTGTQEWVEVNGNSNTKDVLDILRRFA